MRRYVSIRQLSQPLGSSDEVTPLPTGASGASLVTEEETVSDGKTGVLATKIRRIESADSHLNVIFDRTRSAVVLTVTPTQPFRSVSERGASSSGSEYHFHVTHSDANRFVVLTPTQDGNPGYPYKLRIVDNSDPASPMHLPSGSEIEVFNDCPAEVEISATLDGSNFVTDSITTRGGLFRLEARGACVVKKYGHSRHIIIGALV